MDRGEWLLERQTGVGSSDAPNLIGVGFRSALDVYREKTSPPDGRTPTAGPLRRGLDLEPVVAGLYGEVMGVDLVPCELARHPERPWQLASPDRRRADDGRRVELKTTAGFGERWGEPGTADVPVGYRVQCLHQMGVTGDRLLDLAALDVISWELRVYRLEFDAAAWDWLTSAEGRFWFEHVQAGKPPGPEWDREYTTDAAAVVVRPGVSVIFDDEVSKLCDARRAVAAERKRAEAEYDRLSDRLKEVMGEAEIAACPGYRLKRVLVPGGPVAYDRKPYWRLDAKPVKE